MEIKREHQINLFYILRALLGVLAIQSWLYQPTHVKEIPYSEFQKLADRGMFLVRPMTGQGASSMMSIGKSKAKVYMEKDIKTTFADVAGVDEAKEVLMEGVSFL